MPKRKFLCEVILKGNRKKKKEKRKKEKEKRNSPIFFFSLSFSLFHIYIFFYKLDFHITWSRAMPSVTDASFCRFNFTTVSANKRVSSSVFPSGISTTYDSKTTVQISPP